MPPKYLIDRFTDNTTRSYYQLDEAMMTAHREDRDEFAIATARQLLEHADLPLLLRTRACIVIGCSEEEDFLDMAKEAVRIAQLGYDACENPGKLATDALKGAQECLKEAQEAWDEMQKEREENAGNADGEGEDSQVAKDGEKEGET